MSRNGCTRRCDCDEGWQQERVRGGEGKVEARYASLPARVRAPINEKGGPVVGRDAAQPSSARVAGARSSGRCASVLSVRVRRAGAADAHRHRQRRCRTRLGRAPSKRRVYAPLKRIVRGARCGRGGGGAGTSARGRDGARRGGGREQGTSRDSVDAGGSTGFSKENMAGKQVSGFPSRRVADFPL